MHQCAEFEPMQMACFAPYTVVTVLAEAALRLAEQRVCTAARLADRLRGWAGGEISQLHYGCLHHQIFLGFCLPTL